MSSSTASKLEGLIGLASAKRLVLRLAKGDKGAHAVLLYGVPGSGKQALARLLAQAWLCQSPTDEGADGVCRACTSFERGNNSDLLRVAPVGASRIIRTYQITEVKEKVPEPLPIPITTFLRTMPISSRNRVVLIEDAHRMNVSAASALLKTLEEPHDCAKLILTTDSIGGVLPTILSRCLAVACELPQLDELREVMPWASTDMLRMSDGAPGRLISAKEHPEGYERIAQFARAMQTRPVGAALVCAEEFRQIAEGLSEQNNSGARAANALALELLAVFIAREPGCPPAWTHSVVETHRRIVGNASAPIALDALFARMLLELNG